MNIKFIHSIYIYINIKSYTAVTGMILYKVKKLKVTKMYL